MFKTCLCFRCEAIQTRLFSILLAQMRLFGVHSHRAFSVGGGTHDPTAEVLARDGVLHDALMHSPFPIFLNDGWRGAGVRLAAAMILSCSPAKKRTWNDRARNGLWWEVTRWITWDGISQGPAKLWLTLFRWPEKPCLNGPYKYIYR